MFRKLSGASVALLALGCGAAQAQGAPMFNWSGFYAGVGVGYVDSQGTMDQTGAFFLPPNDRKNTLNATGASFSAYVGYNFLVSPMVVLGAEAELGTLGGSDSKKLSPFGGSARVAHDGDLIGSIRGRAGLAFDRTLVFASAGLAYSDAESTAKWNGPDLRWKYKAGSGYVLGLGVEHAITNNLVLRLDGSFYDFGSGKTSAKNDPVGYDFKSAQEAFTVRVGIAYKF